ncbi:MAG: MMPL family transporter [Candidatus Nitrohelix vancouverensis]|uniref:MMPL family transporter n=1 Tax=Candidatus Nitrohelix vancouverensis TaxID=2705534 RepID=A0A7T0G2Q3_9BACT|nr:MAG: MMPL family transporter [Candidatus Nitrohelix vancouverensis]
MAKDLYQGIVDRPWRVILLVLLLVGLAGSGGRFLDFSTNYRVFFSEDNPQLKAFDRLQNTFTKNDNAMIAIAPKDGNVFTPETLALVEEVTKQAWQIPYSTRVDSISNFQHTWADGDDLVVEDLVSGAADYSEADLKRVKEIALNEPLLLNRLITEKSDVTAINVTVNLPEKSLSETPEVIAFVRGMADDIRANHPNVDVYLTGVAFMNNAFDEAGQGDMKTLAPIMYVLIIFILIASIRSFWGTLGTVVIMSASIFTAMGLAGWMGILLTPIAANAPTIILTLAVADSVHLLITLFHEMRAGRSRKESIVESLRVNHAPIFITSVTTAIGFLSLNFSDSPPFRDLGNIVAIGVIAAYALSVTLLPAMMSIFPARARQRAESKALVMDRLADFVIAKRKPLFWGILIAIIAISSQTTRIEIDERFNEYFDHRYQFRADNDFVIENLTGFESIEYSLSAGESGGIANPEYLKTLEAFSDWYRQQPNVMYVGTLTDVMKRLNKNMHGDDPAYYKLPEERDLAAQYLLLYELSLPFGLDLNNQINVDKSSTRLTAVVNSISTGEALELEARAQDWLEEHGLESMRSHGASPLIMFSHIAFRNSQSMLWGVVTALILISGVLVFALRSFKFGLISIVPNLVPIFITFGLWGLGFQQIGLAISVATPVAMGIIVDDTVHFLSKYLRARREQGKSPQDAVRYSFHTVGTALWVTSLALTAGFLALTFSGFTMNVHLGMLTTISIVSALAADFFFLPALLIKLEETHHEQTA